MAEPFPGLVEDDTPAFAYRPGEAVLFNGQPREVVKHRSAWTVLLKEPTGPPRSVPTHMLSRA